MVKGAYGLGLDKCHMPIVMCPGVCKVCILLRGDVE